MACKVCEHCNTAVNRDEAILQGYSYHARCLKCYVCSETNLQNADTFKGVIFCYGCSNRIFQGCSTARRAKMRRSKRPAYTAYKEREKRRQERGYNKYANRVLERARLTAMDSRSFSGQSNEHKARLVRNTAPSTVATALTSYTYRMPKSCKLEKDSVEIGTTTTVTKELLKHIHSPTDIESKTATPAKPRKKRKNEVKKNYYKNNHCSDLRVAELGASTEIAHVALRKRSEIPIIIKSEINSKRTASETTQNLSNSDISGEGDSRRTHYSECSSDLTDSHGMSRTIASMIKLPYKSFKRNILDRSSLISVIMSSREPDCILHKFRTLFQHEITEHQRRGLKRLFSTINRRKEQYKLGWLDVMSRIPEDERIPDKIKKREKRCRHFKQSHSYRCMRSQVMRLAGPTRSELAVLRKKLKNALCFNLCKGLRDYNNQYADILTSVACEQSRKAPGPVRLCSDT
ncbi:uncharacterized protein LOC123871151 isoform X2 [Maniola jurtina]|uniref:uncharacterized protein LOC123871151 isoform X2 n=1 Tax=Maniola jurtina TaxID=191418 RepID=UPI001E686976|nr:uncharacterized protein LOC123871151 isoform X2 [Maniola jurtina]